MKRRHRQHVKVLNRSGNERGKSFKIMKCHSELAADYVFMKLYLYSDQKSEIALSIGDVDMS